ncbi:MAG TPA: hypothetical protein VN894_05580 [Polyangiaceae bacterium]|nr:hypothetical protein [Polyangiaceae bacterium]
MRELLPLALLAFACSAVMRQPLGCARSARPPSAPSGAGRAEAPASSGAAPSFAALAARGASVAPGMREVARIESAGDRVEIVRAEGGDACVRVAFEASSPVVARLLDSEGNVLASSDAPAADGVLGQRGPVCVRRGDSVSAAAGGAGAAVASVRWVAWQAP